MAWLLRKRRRIFGSRLRESTGGDNIGWMVRSKIRVVGKIHLRQRISDVLNSNEGVLDGTQMFNKIRRR